MAKVATDACLDTMKRLANTVPDETLPAKAEREALADAIGEINKRKTIADYGLEAVINGYLSGTMTPIANALSIGVQNLLRPTVYAIGALTDATKITKGDRSMRDAYAMLQAATEGFVADLHYFRTGWLRGYPIDVPGTVREIAGATDRTVKEVKQSIGEAFARRKALEDKVDPNSEEFARRIQQARDDAAKWDNEDPRIGEYVHEGYDYIRKTIPGKGGEIVRIPTKLTVAIDEYGKARFRRQKVAQLASLKARKEAGTDDVRYRELFESYKRQASVITNDFGEMEKTMGRVFGTGENDWIPYTTIREFALDNTFQSRLYGIPAQIQKLKNEGGSASRLVLGTMVPFVKTPWNILKEGTTYVPGLPFALRPKYSEAGRPVKMSNDELIPRQILGTAMFATIMSMYAAGRVTGAPRDGDEAQSWKDEGKAAFAIKLGDTWIPYQRIEPIATAFGLAGDLARAIEDYASDPNPDKKFYGDLITDVMIGLKYHIMSKSFMEGFSLVLEGATDPARVDEQIASQLLRPLTPAIVNEAARILDPYERQATTPLEKLQQRIPTEMFGFGREALPVEYGLYGGPRETNRVQAITGFGIVSESDRSPLQMELSRLNYTKGRVGDKIKGLEMSNEQIARYRQLAAERITPVLEALINSPSWNNLTDARKRYVLDEKIAELKGKASKQMFAELYRDDPKFAKRFYNKIILSKGLEEQVELKQ
jgi:hypothetical protein